MKSMMALRNTLRQQLASNSRLPVITPPCSSYSIASSSSRRHLHTSPALDPKDDAEVVTAMNTQTKPAAEAVEGVLPDTEKAVISEPFERYKNPNDTVFVPLRYLHKSTAIELPAPGKRLPRSKMRWVPLSKHVFGQEPRRDILHAAVVYYLDSLRQGTASTKTRGEVAYSTRKILQQKGTGKARAGSKGSPIRRGGGVSHGPKPRDFATELPRRVRELALRSALSAKWKSGHLHIVNSFYWDPPPKVTTKLVKTLSGRLWTNALFLTAPRDPRLSTDKSPFRRAGRPSALDPVYTPEQQLEHTHFLRNFALAERSIKTTELIRLDVMTEAAQENAKKDEDRKKPWELPAYTVLRKKDLVLDLGAVEWLEQKLGGTFLSDDDKALSRREKAAVEEQDVLQVLQRWREQIDAECAEERRTSPKVEGFTLDAVLKELEENQGAAEDETPADSTVKQSSA